MPSKKKNLPELSSDKYQHIDDAKLNILIVDSDTQMRAKIISEVSDSYNFYEAKSFEEALDIINSKFPDCAFVQLEISNSQGKSLLQCLYNPEKDNSSLPIVCMATSSNEAEALQALRHGAQDYIQKNYLTRTSIKIAVSKAIEIYQVKKSNFESQQKLQHIHRMEAVGQLTSGIAHDFNNLLTVILGNTRLIRRRIARGEKEFSMQQADGKIESIEIAATKGADLVRRMMIFTRQSALKEEISDLNKCICDVSELLKRSLGEAIKIEIIEGLDIWPVSIDVREFENALINLSVNARDAMKSDGKITIETSNIILDQSYALSYPGVAPGPYVLVSFSDNGEGMDSETMKRIFEPFFTTKQAGEGTGLGLSMVYGFIRQSRGYIHVYSEIGHGTVFRIYLPRVRLDQCQEETAKEFAEAPVGKETVLVVEDDPEVLLIASSMLEKLGYKVIKAESGRIALGILKQKHKSIDIVFTDIVMPDGLSGIQLVQQVREYYPDVKVLYTSGYSEKAIPDYQLSVGEELICKPYRRESLAQKIRKVLDSDKVINK